MATAKKTTARKPVTAKSTPAKKAVTAKAAAPVLPKPVKPAKPAKPAKAVKAEKPKKPKMVRDSFTIPKDEYAVLDELKKRAASLAHPVKKSEILRAGIKALNAMAGAAFLSALQSVPAIKTGRPSKP